MSHSKPTNKSNIGHNQRTRHSLLIWLHIYSLPCWLLVDFTWEKNNLVVGWVRSQPEKEGWSWRMWNVGSRRVTGNSVGEQSNRHSDFAPPTHNFVSSSRGIKGLFHCNRFNRTRLLTPLKWLKPFEDINYTDIVSVVESNPEAEFWKFGGGDPRMSSGGRTL